MFTIASRRFNLEQGGHYYDLVIEKDGGYGTGDFPPLFHTQEAANKYLQSMDRHYDKAVVEITVADDLA